MITTRSKVTVPPTEEPVSLEEAKAFMRITHSSEDAYITGLIETARIMAEDYTKRKFVSQTVEDYRDRFAFEIPWWDGVRDGSINEFQERVLEIRYLPVISLVEVSTFSEENVETTYDPNNYELDTVSLDRRARIILEDGANWPANLRRANAVKVEYIAGYGDADDVPGPIKNGILMLINYMYENRGACGCTDTSVSQSGAMASLNRYRIRRVA